MLHHIGIWLIAIDGHLLCRNERPFEPDVRLLCGMLVNITKVNTETFSRFVYKHCNVVCYARTSGGKHIGQIVNS